MDPHEGNEHPHEGIVQEVPREMSSYGPHEGNEHQNIGKEHRQHLVYTEYTGNNKNNPLQYPGAYPICKSTEGENNMRPVLETMTREELDNLAKQLWDVRCGTDDQVEKCALNVGIAVLMRMGDRTNLHRDRMIHRTEEEDKA